VGTHRLSRRGLLKGAAASSAAFSVPTIILPSTRAQDGWSLAQAAEPYQGTSINCFFLERPGYRAAEALIPQFEEETGIEVTFEITPYENSHEKQVLDWTGMTGQFDVSLVDVVWIGEFAAAGWIAPMQQFFDDPNLADPNLNLEGFFPILLESFGTWDEQVYGLPFDNYSGLLYYNEAMLQEAGFDGPPESWQQLFDEYGPALTQGDQYAFALQSRRGETQSADSFMRMVWAFGGSLLDDNFEPNLSSEESLAGLQFRQDLMQYMPSDITEWDHDEAVQGLAQGRVAMITEWSSFYPTLSDPATSTITEDLRVALEPAGADGQPHPALGGFSLAVNAQSSPEKQAAAYLFIQWITSEEQAIPYIENGGVSGRMSAYEDPSIQETYAYVEPLVKSWNDFGNPVFRPRFPEWPQISEIIAQVGSEMMLGQVEVEEGAASIDEQMRSILQPYYDGEKPKLQ
jgi:multiple sugar transport system substrate-binding protein